MFQSEQVKFLLHEALRLDGDVDRVRWLEEQCEGDRSALEEVCSLLEAHDGMAQATSRRKSSFVASDVPSARFGAYRAKKLIACGGMSAVYLAHRDDGQFEQTVALKIMAGYLAGPEFLGRFETERKLLATLNHNHITRLLDGGISSAGDPYLITEFVDGQTIERYCNELRLNIKARLRIFLQVAEAVEYAHRNLIVHRDLKPGNILVDGQGSVKLLDFGTASLLAERADVDVTRTRARMITPRYASPEQLRGDHVNTATDVFSLGVVLYELVTGAWPFGDPASVLSELSRATGDVQPLPPSTVITEEAADQRAASRVDLVRGLKGDLAPVILKALECDPARRYESVRLFIADLENFLAGRPVLARPQTLLYRSGKFLRRRWIPVTAAAIFTVGLSTATAIALQQVQTARKAAQKSERVSRFLGELMSSGTRGGPGFTVAQMLDLAEPELEKSWKDDPQTEAVLRMNLGASYTTMQLPDRATYQLQRALALYHTRGDLKGEVGVLWILGSNAQVQGHLRNSVRFQEQALERLKLLGNKAVPVWMFRVRRELGTALSVTSTRSLPEAQRLLKDAIGLALREPSIPASELIEAYATLGRVLAEEGKDEAAEAAFAQATSAWHGMNGHGDLDSILSARTAISARKLDWAAAAGLARRRYEQWVQQTGPGSVTAACASLDWARFRALTGEVGQASAQLGAAMPVIRKFITPGNDFLWFSLNAAAQVSSSVGHFDEAERYAREALKVLDEAQRDEPDTWRAEVLDHLGAALAGRGRYREAMPVLEEAEATYRKGGPAWVRSADQTLASGRRAEAESRVRQ